MLVVLFLFAFLSAYVLFECRSMISIGPLFRILSNSFTTMSSLRRITSFPRSRNHTCKSHRTVKVRSFGNARRRTRLESLPRPRASVAEELAYRNTAAMESLRFDSTVCYAGAQRAEMTRSSSRSQRRQQIRGLDVEIAAICPLFVRPGREVCASLVL